MNITIRHDFRPGDIGYVIYMHGIFYSKLYGFDTTFDGYVAEPMGAFAKNYNPERERLWIVEKDNEIVGSIAMVDIDRDTAQLRWFILLDAVQGQGIGRKLIQEAIQFCRDAGYKNILLWTASQLDAAKYLYESVGFELSESLTHEIWGVDLTEERYDLALE